MYKPKYTFWNEKQFPGFVDSLDRIYNDSVDNYKKTHNDLIDKELEVFNTFIKDLEYYYAILICEGIEDLNNPNKNILNQLKSIKHVVIPKKRDLYGATLGNQVSINPDIDAAYGLDKKCFMQLCISHELGHIVNKKWYLESKELSKKLYKDPRNIELFENLEIDDYRYLLFGFDLINEVVAEDVAERVAFRLAKKKKDRSIGHNKYILYDELYKYAFEFAKSLDFIRSSKNISENSIMLELIKNSFSEDFISNISKEIENSDYNKRDKLLTILVCMGKIKASSYEVVGLNKNKESINVDKYIDTFNETIKRK